MLNNRDSQNFPELELISLGGSGKGYQEVLMDGELSKFRVQ